MATEKPEVLEEMEKRDKMKEQEELNEVFERLTTGYGQNTQPERSTNSEAEDLASRSAETENDEPRDCSNNQDQAVLLDYEEDPKLIEAYQRELDRRWEVWKCWNERSTPEEEGFPRPKIQKLSQKGRIVDVFLDYYSFVTLYQLCDAFETGILGESEC